jgi:hypothetical protein
VDCTVKALYQRLDSLGIRSYGAETVNSGVLLTLYTNGGEIVFHARDTAQIADAQTRAYVRQATPLCPNWHRSEY